MYDKYWARAGSMVGKWTVIGGLVEDQWRVSRGCDYSKNTYFLMTRNS